MEATSSKKKITMEKKRKHTLDSRYIKNKKAIQLSYLIGLVNQFCTITYERPRKKASTTRQLFHVKILNFNNENFEIGEYLNKQCLKYYDEVIASGLSKKNATRRFEDEKIVILFDLLIDILFEYGFIIFTSKMRNKVNKSKIDFIEEVYYRSTLIANEKEISIQGTLINDYLFSKTNITHREFTLQQKDKVVIQFIEKNYL
ncbi:hypothetical protein EDI_163070 [Entamoeba dispar SAW760]|uniref:Uncharacterized protein n=1 Tax=Entamoeba dispar (strain ATCC PRA-260 / SAW760) TaxID=370354 RepID=B0ECQ8_ENTDS|nr:uncharacterized protein EDI_163070 [Entamoeba dispar SAW760]EDR27695.1 hypothetical protein EDI_163070 [Entamoeba dispar SAW760]|eukprot:EDR27695.1 hypothetical protein EDI_163070 [Entamoeba dispar SAW760]